MPIMVEPEAGILRLAIELRQIIYDYVVSYTPDRSIKVTLDLNDRLHFQNGKTLLNLICTNNTFRQEVPSYLFQCFTFVLTDSQRTCRPIVAAFFRSLKSENRVRVQKVAIPFFTIRGLFDPAHPRLWQDQFHNRHAIPGLQINAYLLERLNPRDDWNLQTTQAVLRQDLYYVFLLLNQMPALQSVEFGVDVTELLFYCDNQYEWPFSSFDDTLGIVGKKTFYDHPLLMVLGTIKNMGKLRRVQLKLKWSNFVFDSYTRAGAVFPPAWTHAIKEEMRKRFEDIIAACTSG